MRYTRNLTGLERIIQEGRKSRKKYKDYSWYYDNRRKTIESKDTKIRKDINLTIKSMIDAKKNDIQIEMYLTQLYPDYSEYIPKMISHHFSKLKEANIKNEITEETRE